METIKTIGQLFTYNHWANRRVLDSFKDPLNHDPRAIRVLAHLLIAEKMWLVRLLNNEDTTGFNFWPELGLEECEALAEENRKAYAVLFDSLTENDLDSVAIYKNSKGVEYRTSYRDILLHVAFHGTYHRGQVASQVRAGGGTPAYTDYIAFVRESEEASGARSLA